MVNATPSLPRELLERLASDAGPGAARVTAVWDQYVSFVAAEPRVFHTAQRGAYVAVSRGPDDAAQRAVAQAIDRLLCAVVTAGVRPLAPFFRQKEVGWYV